MIISKVILQILKKNKGMLLLGFVVMIVSSVIFSTNLKQKKVELDGAKIAIFDKDHSELSEALIHQLKQQHQVVKLEDTTKKGVDDALFFNKVSYILTIPEDFSQQVTKGVKPELESRSKPGTFHKFLVNATVDHYLNTYFTYQRNMTDTNTKQLLSYTKKTVEETGDIRFDQTYHRKKRQKVQGNIFNMLAYGLFVSVFSGYGIINLAFNREEIRNRNRCSPVPRKTFSRYISIGCLLYSLVCLVIFTAVMMGITRSSFNQVGGYFILSILVFFIPMISFSIMASSLIKNMESITGISNVYILGSCFIGGVFVPAEYLPDSVTKIAMFTPTYWFAQNNELIGRTVDFNQAFKEDFMQNSVILLGFALLFLVIHLVSMRETGGLKIFGKKAAALGVKDS